MPETPVISASEVTREFAPNAGVFDLDLHVAPGSIMGFIGPSGSGKTTTVRLMTGVERPDSGRLVVFGEKPTEFKRSTRARIGYMPQQTILYPDLSLQENLHFAASLFGMPYRRKREMKRVIDFVELDGAIDRMPREASGGEKRRVMLASTLLHSPDLIFLDEPTAGIDPVLRRKFWDRFEELGKDGRTLLVTTQYVGEAAYCDYVAVLDSGRILTIDTPDGLRRTAYGGEMIEVAFAVRPSPEDIASLAGVALDGQTPRWIDARSVRLVVDDAGTAAPEISKWATERGVEVEKAEAFLPPFDDVFVELVSRLDDQGDEVAADVA